MRSSEAREFQKDWEKSPVQQSRELSRVIWVIKKSCQPDIGFWENKMVADVGFKQLKEGNIMNDNWKRFLIDTLTMWK